MLNVNRVKDKRDQIWVLFQHFDPMSALCEIIDSEDSETFERRVIRLQILLYDRVQLIVVCCDIAGREVLDNDTEQHHCKLFLNQIFRLSVLEHKLEKLRPLLLWDQNFAQLANHICDVFLHDWDWLSNESLEKQIFCLDLIRLWQRGPMLSNDFTEVYRCELSDDLDFVVRHKQQQIL